MKKLIASSILMTAGFLIAVILYGKVYNSICGIGVQIDEGYTTRQVILAISGESIRAVITSWLYNHHKSDKSLIWAAFKFGIICSMLVGSIWLLLGVEFLNQENKISFIVNDGIILTLQGILSGFVLWLIYRNEKPAHNKAYNDHGG